MTLDTTISGASADSYGSLAASDTYNDARQNLLWVNGDDDKKEALLRYATTYLDAHYRSKWKGRRKTQTQSLAWPRVGVCDEDGMVVSSATIPQAIVYATFEAAYAELINPGTLFPAIERETRAERVGPISVEYTQYASQQTTLTSVRDLISGLLIFGGSTTAWLARA